MIRSLFLMLALVAAPFTASAQAASGLPPVSANDRVLGREDAPVTVIEYASLICGHCAEWHRTVYPEFKRQFIDTGRARLVFRDLPTQPSPVVAARAAAVARCAVPARFYDVIDVLFDNQEMAFNGGAQLAWYATGVAVSGRTQTQIDACLADRATLDGVRASLEGAVAAGVEGTPTFFVNGRKVEDRSLAGLSAAIQPLLPRR